jgi:hypothetical protein
VPRYPESSKNRLTDLLGFYSFLIHSTAKRWICYLVACLVKGLPFFLLFFGCTPRDLSVLDVSVSVDPSRSPHARRADGLLDLKKKTSRVFRYLRARLAQIYLFKKEKNQLFELISIVSGLRSDSPLPSLKGEKKTSFLFCVVWHSSLNAGRNGTRRDCATTI